ncbi:hypothetical protein NCG89_08005 [Spongiibacter taiwanensis]|uniref:hypothetical protein n=1 Tax=Spongiibacter taiwanensis TaxID=1748242 RepID=UPI0020356DFA|nr:hypothetical protein [Spongiibacter taiwanensis]USA44697.1 hypothetical protein NCG89_08005 [Spongiibacter taiwanensis]
MNTPTKRLLSSITLSIAASANAQIPVVGDLLNGASLDSAIVGALPLDQLTDSAHLLRTLNPNELSGSLDGLLFAATIVSPAFQDIPKLVPTSLDISLAQGFVPVLEVLFTRPANLPNYLLGGGTLVSPGLAYVPAAPILSAPLKIDGTGDAFSGQLPDDQIRPDVVLSLILGQLSAGSALLPPLALPL